MYFLIVQVSDNFGAFTQQFVPVTITNFTFTAWVPPLAEENLVFMPKVYGLNCAAFIESISVTGEMLILFNATMLTDFNLTFVNHTNVDIYVVPAMDRDKHDNTFNEITVNFTWHVLNYTDK